jgi:hypothetical protein
VAFVVGVAVAAWLWGRTTHQPDEVLPPVAALPGTPRS